MHISRLLPSAVGVYYAPPEGGNREKHSRVPPMNNRQSSRKIETDCDFRKWNLFKSAHINVQMVPEGNDQKSQSPDASNCPFMLY